MSSLQDVRVKPRADAWPNRHLMLANFRLKIAKVTKEKKFIWFEERFRKALF